jgi:hypothetical protein
LVTCAALILFLAFAALASGPVVELKVFATGVGVGILLDATVVRALLVPALVSLLGRWNWWWPFDRSASRGPVNTPLAESTDGAAEDIGGGIARGRRYDVEAVVGAAGPPSAAWTRRTWTGTSALRSWTDNERTAPGRVIGALRARRAPGLHASSLTINDLALTVAP